MATDTPDQPRCFCGSTASDFNAGRMSCDNCGKVTDECNCHNIKAAKPR